jgi:hypothetical protein
MKDVPCREIGPVQSGSGGDSYETFLLGSLLGRNREVKIVTVVE